MMSVAQKQSDCRRGGGGGRMNRNVFFFLTELIYLVIEACAPQIIRLRPPLSDELEMLLLNVNETQSQSCSICKRSRFLFYLPRLMAAPGSQPFVTGRGGAAQLTLNPSNTSRSASCVIQEPRANSAELQHRHGSGVCRSSAGPHTHSNAPYLLTDKSTAGNRCYRFVLQTSNVASALMKRARRADRVLQAGTC